MEARLLAPLITLLLLGAGATGLVATDTDPGSTPAAPAAEIASGAQSCVLDSSTDHVLTPEGVEIAITVHKPVLGPTETVPLILHSHGWAGSRATEASGLVSNLVKACYGVLSIDMRGHGDSGGQANVHSPDHEIQDVVGILDWAHDELDWVTTEPGSNLDKDLLVGAIGGSYGGGYQLLTAAEDERLDAIAPEITWNSLPYALAPNGAIKSVWVDLLYAGGTASAELAPFIDEGYAWANAFNEFPDGDQPGEPDVMSRFVKSSPASHQGKIDVPTLLIQGMPDTLFNLNQAVRNYHQIDAATNAEVNLVTHLDGHILSTDGTIPDGSPVPMGLQPGAREGACGDLDALVVGWYDEHLKGLGDDGAAEVEIALDDNQTCLSDARTADLVLGDASGQVFEIGGPVVATQGAGLASGYVEAGAVEATATSPAAVELFTVTGQTAITGIPRLTAQASVLGTDAIAYLSIVVESDEGARIVDSQVTPIRLQGPTTEQAIDVALGGIGAALEEGDTVSLQVTTSDPQYAHNAGREPGALVLDDVTLELPVQ